MSVKGYKVFNPDWTCRGFQYEVGKTYKHEGKIGLCEAGFHFCKALSNCFRYYPFQATNKVAEVEAIGEVITDEHKCVTNEIVIIKELSWYEVLDLANSGNCNSGGYNSGNCNSGNYNSGNWNSGHRNSGNFNSGNCNSGNYNSGYRNSGNCDSGNCNSGNYNSGNYNSGNYNSGNFNSGDYNSGDYNSGNCNSGNWNSGYRNSGNFNSGNRNSGDYNSGNYNSGNYNSGNYNSGYFNTINQPLYIFNKPVNMNRHDFYDLPGIIVINSKLRGESNKWVDEKYMTNEEKEAHPDYKITGGYLKTAEYKESWASMWRKLTEEEKEEVKNIPNFDPEVFKEITGIDVNEQEKG